MAIDIPATVACVWIVGIPIGFTITPFALGLSGQKVQMGDSDSLSGIWLWLIWPLLTMILLATLCLWVWSDGLNAIGLWLNSKFRSVLAGAAGQRNPPLQS